MVRKLGSASALAALLFVGCSSDPEPTGTNDAGSPSPTDSGTATTPPTPDAGEPPPPPPPPPDAGGTDMDAGAADTGEPPPPPPPSTLRLRGIVTKLGAYLAGNNQFVGEASVFAYGVEPLASAASSPNTPTLGEYELTVPANGQIVLFANKQGYFPTYTQVTTQDAEIVNQRTFITELAWLNAIAAAHRVNMDTSFPCRTQALVGEQCIYAIVAGRILDDGTAGNGTVRPVAGVRAADFSITGANDAPWSKEGPYFLSYDGTVTASASASLVYQNTAGEYVGGLYITFVEVPQIAGPPYQTLRFSIRYNDNGTPRYFGPISVQAFRPYAVSWLNVAETGIAPPTVLENINFDTQVYPLFLPVNQGGLGCQGCHTNQAGAQPAGGMNLYGGPEAAFDSLNPAAHPQRVNVTTPEDSLLLKRPLYEAQGAQDHPIFAFASPADLAYQAILTWIREGAVRQVVLPPVSFTRDVRPLLSQPTANGGAGCFACHVQGVNAANAPGGLYMGGNGDELYNLLANTAPRDPGPYNEPFRINKNNLPERSLVLTNPLTGNAEPHPVKIFYNNTDPRYQLIYRWIVEGYVNDTP